LDIVKTVHQLKNIYKQISLLIQAADALMDENGWKPDSSTVSYGSKAYYSPEEWLASVLVRAYKHTKKEDERKLLGIVLDVDKDKSFDKFKEPLVTGASMKMNNVDLTFGSWYVSDVFFWFLKNSESVADGKFRVIEPSELDPKDKRELGPIGVVGFPLMDIGDSEALKKNIVKPLLDELTD